MKNTIIREHPGLESIAGGSQQAMKLLQKRGYAIIDPDTMRRIGEGFEAGRRIGAKNYRRYMSDPASYNHQ